MRTGIVSFSLGVLAGGFIPWLPPLSQTLVLWIPALLCRWCRSLSLGAAFLAGVWWLLFQATLHQQSWLPAELEQVDIWITGTVSGLPQGGADYTRLAFVANAWCKGADVQPCDMHPVSPARKFLVNDYTGNHFVAGERWRLQVRLKRPRGFANPGGFDYELWLFRQGFSATGYIRAAIPAGSMAVDPGSLLDRWRGRLRDWLDLQPLASQAFLAALTIGDRGGISDRQWQLLTLSGTNHLMVISGLHIGLVAWLAFHLGRGLARLCPACCLRVPANRLAAVLALVMALLYSGLAGFSLPVQRALIMVCCLMGGQLLSRQTQPLNSLSLALLLVVLLDPLAPHSAGFWLSFVAVALLLLSLPGNADPAAPATSRLLQPLRTQYVLFLGLAPVMLVLFRQVSLLAPLVNLIAIPFVGLLVVPLCLLVLAVRILAPDMAATLVLLPDRLLSVLEWSLAALTAQLDFLLVRFPALPAWLVALVSLALAVHLWRPQRLTWVVLAGILCLAYRYTGRPLPAGAFDLDILDVGQGLAVVVTTRNHVLIYDTGPAYSPRFNAGSGVIRPFLEVRNKGVPSLIMTSHGDGDHAGGLPALLAAYPRTRVLAGEPAGGRSPDNDPCLAGQSWTWDEVRFQVLAPPGPGNTGNNASCVLKISAGDHSVLLPGDIEADVELALVRRYRETLAADILVAPHHGSGTSSTMPFLRQVGAAHVIFTTGYRNRFGHPQPAVLARYRYLGSVVHHTAHAGAMHFRVSRNDGIGPPQAYRETRPRFWASGLPDGN